LASVGIGGDGDATDGAIEQVFIVNLGVVGKPIDLGG